MDEEQERPDIATRFKPGNQALKARSSHGRKPKFKSPDELWEKCCEYFEWVNANPLMAVELVKYQGKVTQVQLHKMRPMTMIGLCTFLDISRSTWTAYSQNPDFLRVTERVERIIWVYKFEGAAVGLLNPNIIARELGLVGKRRDSNCRLADVNIY